jgi:hypothetical protein
VPLAVTVVRVWEPDPPAGVEPLDWVLLTNVACATAADAWERADGSARRWGVAELHKLPKTGVGIEKLPLTTVHRLENAIAVRSVVAVALLVLRDAAWQPGAERSPAGVVVGPLGVEVRSRWRYGVSRELSVREWVLTLGRLGGQQNRASDGPPGWQTLWRGWQRLTARTDGWRLRHDLAPPINVGEPEA